MPTVKKIKASAPVNKKITRGEDEVEVAETPTLAVKKRVPTAFKVRQGMIKKK